MLLLHNKKMSEWNDFGKEAVSIGSIKDETLPGILGLTFTKVPPWKIWRSLFTRNKRTRQKSITTTLDLCFLCSLYTSLFVLTSQGRYLIHNGRSLLLLIYFLFIIFGIPWRNSGNQYCVCVCVCVSEYSEHSVDWKVQEG